MTGIATRVPNIGGLAKTVEKTVDRRPNKISAGGGGQPAPSWVIPGASQDTDFVNDRYYNATPGVDILLTRASPKNPRNAAGQIVPIASGAFARTDLGLSIEPLVAAKNTNFNANPTDLTGVTKKGDAAAVLSLVDDTPALSAAGLLTLCPSGMVYALDNRTGTGLASAEVSGPTGNLNPHICVVFQRGSGTASPFVATTGSLNAPSNMLTANYQQVVSASQTSNAGRVSNICAAPGTIVYFILNQLIEATVPSSPIVTAGAGATRQADIITQAKTIPPVQSIVLAGLSPAINTSNEILLELDDGTTNNRLQISRTGSQIKLVIFVGNVSVLSQVIAANAVNTTFIIGVSWDGAGNYHVSMNGGAVTAYAVSALPALSRLLYGQSPGGEFWYGYLQRLALFNKVLTDAELVTYSNPVTYQSPF